MEKFTKLQFLILLLIAFSMISGCNSQRATDENVPEASVTPDQAKAVAQDEYDVSNIQEINLRHLTDEELKLLNDEQSQLTPVYFMISGLVDEEPVTVYVSSNEVTHHFIKY